MGIVGQERSYFGQSCPKIAQNHSFHILRHLWPPVANKISHDSLQRENWSHCSVMDYYVLLPYMCAINLFTKRNKVENGVWKQLKICYCVGQAVQCRQAGGNGQRCNSDKQAHSVMRTSSTVDESLSHLQRPDRLSENKEGWGTFSDTNNTVWAEKIETWLRDLN